MLEARSLYKSFGSIEAVKDLSFSLEKGTVLGFLGPNGAGKSTTMRMLTGFLTPTKGTALIQGFDVQIDALKARRCMGYLPEGAPLYLEMTVQQFLLFIARIRNIPRAELATRLGEALERLSLTDVAGQTIETLSKGYRRRVGIAQALIHDPAVLILDEPTDGLDPNQKRDVRQLIRNMADDKLIIVSTHILGEVSALCNRVMIIAGGELKADNSPVGLLQTSRYYQAVTLRADNPQSVATELSNLPEAAQVELKDHELTIFPRKGAKLLPLVTKLAEQQQWNVQSLRLEEGRLDDVFRRVTTEAAQ
ncbi:MAG: ABC transporter ATP-binding protein [Xanthomonadales bacterium]|nr:ABC transporter ATP-binding protein [Xanthomonadales bacterium]